ncbi:hypothetical protein [Treponema vincentii]|uniref:hypothetical protein n=1 Tax=Treponema vincentii TaxID=69710 RepID=UPI003D8DADA4
MIKQNKIRMPLDIAMTALSIILMGGTVLFPDDKIHQILGMTLLASAVLYNICSFSSSFSSSILTEAMFCLRWITFQSLCCSQRLRIMRE